MEEANCGGQMSEWHSRKGAVERGDASLEKRNENPDRRDLHTLIFPAHRSRVASRAGCAAMLFSPAAHSTGIIASRRCSIKGNPRLIVMIIARRVGSDVQRALDSLTFYPLSSTDVAYGLLITARHPETERTGGWNSRRGKKLHPAATTAQQRPLRSVVFSMHSSYVIYCDFFSSSAP